MPIHDWTRVSAGTFHALHVAWLAELQRALNGGVLPSGFYALAEQAATDTVPDVLTLRAPVHRRPAPVSASADHGEVGGLAVATAPPRTSVRDTLGDAFVTPSRRRRIVIRHASQDDAVALLEVVSPGNKDRRSSVDQFVGKAVAALRDGLNLQVIDLFRPGRFDPGGLHATIWAELGGDFDPPPDRPLTLAAYTAMPAVSCYVEPSAVGMALADLPLFVTPDRYVNVPLEATYMAAYAGLPRRWTEVIEALPA